MASGGAVLVPPVPDPMGGSVMNVASWTTLEIDRWVASEQESLRLLNEELYVRTYTLSLVFRELERRLIRPS